MFRLNGIAWLGLLLACGPTVLAGSDEELFREMTLERARETASKGGKRLVVIDFYTVWCGPCKKLDETTWKDQGVRDWLAKEAVCLKVDAEKDEALAEKYRVNAYPTILLLRTDGTEVDRLVGYRDPKTFLDDTADAMAGNDSLSRARQKLGGINAKDPMLRMSYGDALAQKGRAEDALSEYLWCFDHGLEHGPGFTGVRLSFLLSRIVQMSRTNPAALDELRKRRDAAARAIEGRTTDFSKAMEFTSLNSNLGETGRTLDLYDRIKGDRFQSASITQYLLGEAIDQLLEAKRYKEVLADLDPREKIRELIANDEQMKQRMPDDAGLRDYMKKQVVLNAAKYYEALLGSGDQTGAGEVAASLITFDPVGAFRPMIAAARRAGDEKTADRLAEQARVKSNPGATP